MAKPIRSEKGIQRLFGALASLFFLASPSLIYALGLGEIEMQSALNQPMNAAIELTSSAGIDLSKVSVTLAPQADHQRVGLSRSSILNDFKFKVAKNARGNAVVNISSDRAVQEPFLEFLLELSWPNGRLLREYTILIDPPLTMPARAASPATPVSRAPAATRSTRPTTRASQPAPVPVRTAAVAASADSYGPIRRNENLWSIAEKLRRDPGVTNQQMMLALQRKNPQAFINGNINNLRADVTLAVPSRDEILALSSSEAQAEARRQYSEWKNGQPPQDTGVATATEQMARGDTAVAGGGESRLQITAPDLDAVAGAAAPGDPLDTASPTGEASNESLNQQLALATEEAATSQAESAEYQSRVTELEGQVETLSKLMQLKDAALAMLQAQVAGNDVMEDTLAATEPDGKQIAAESGEIVEETVIETEAGSEFVDEDVELVTATEESPGGLLDTVLDNPLLSALGVLTAVILAAFAWSSTRRKQETGLFGDETTLARHLSATGHTADDQPVVAMDVDEQNREPDEQPFMPDAQNDAGDPVTEADVYLAYGRIQQAEDVLQSALANEPDNHAIRIKLLEVYHAAGNVTAFDREAGTFRDGISEEDALWVQVAAMGYAMSPGNDLYRAAAQHTADGIAELNQSGDDRSADDGQPLHADSEGPGLDETINIVAADDYDEDISEGLLDTADEVTTKLDLARAYLDMGDSEGARGILDEVLQEGNDEQKNEAEALITKLA